MYSQREKRPHCFAGVSDIDKNPSGIILITPPVRKPDRTGQHRASKDETGQDSKISQLAGSVLWVAERDQRKNRIETNHPIF